MIAAPWTIYTAFTFPIESGHERGEAWRRMTEVLESQGGPPWTYVAEMPRFFGELIYVPVAIAIWFVLRRRSSHEQRALLLWAAIPYVVFSICATKAPGYVMVAAPPIFLMQADVWLWLWRKRQAAFQLATRILFGAMLFLIGRSAGATTAGANRAARAARAQSEMGSRSATVDGTHRP